MTKIITIKNIEDAFTYVRNIRDAVFVKEQGIVSDEEYDKYDFDESTDYFVLLEDEVPVATARIAYMPKGAKIGRIAVVSDCRGKHYGAKIVSYALNKLFNEGFDCVYLDSQNHAVGFYERLGFKICGSEITDRGIKHLPMMITPATFRGE